MNIISILFLACMGIGLAFAVVYFRNLWEDRQRLKDENEALRNIIKTKESALAFYEKNQNQEHWFIGNASIMSEDELNLNLRR